MSFKHFLEQVGHDALAVITFGASAKGQAVIGAIENTAVVAGGLIGGVSLANAIGGLEALINKGLQGIFNAQALATAAETAGQNVTGAQKAAAVTTALAADSSALLKSLGVSEPTDDEVQEFATVVNNSLVTILQALPATTTATTAVVQPSVPVAVPAMAPVAVSAPATWPPIA